MPWLVCTPAHAVMLSNSLSEPVDAAAGAPQRTATFSPKWKNVLDDLFVLNDCSVTSTSSVDIFQSLQTLAG